MWFLWDLFNDVIDITAAPVKFIARWTDKIIESDLEDFVNDMKDSLKTK